MFLDAAFALYASMNPPVVAKQDETDATIPKKNNAPTDAVASIDGTNTRNGCSSSRMNPTIANDHTARMARFLNGTSERTSHVSPTSV